MPATPNPPTAGAPAQWPGQCKRLKHPAMYVYVYIYIYTYTYIAGCLRRLHCPGHWAGAPAVGGFGVAGIEIHSYTHGLKIAQSKPKQNIMKDT